MSDRIKNLINDLLSIKPEICVERAKLITSSYQETEGFPILIRRAKALEKILTETSIYIKDNELIVGNQGSKPRVAPIFPEYGVEWLERELKNVSKRKVDPFICSEKTIEELEEIFKYWKGKTTYDYNKHLIETLLPKEIEEVYDLENSKLNEVISNSGRMSGGNGHIIANYKKVLEKGLNFIIEEAKEKLLEFDRPKNSEEADKKIFLKSVIISLEAVIKFAKRFSKLASKMAQEETDIIRKIELERIAEICDWVPANPARNLWEAIQAYWFIHLVIQIEDNGHSISFGRFDQYLYPFYKNDISNNILTKGEAIELVACLYIKANTLNKIRNWHHTMVMHGYPLFQTLVIGGQDKNGEDATNDFSYICLDALGEVKLPQPTVVARICSKTPNYFIIKCVETLQKHGGGLPAFFNDEVAIPLLTSIGVTIEDARDWAVTGCSEPTIPGKTNPITGGTCHINLLKILELALNNGKNLNNGITLCKGNGDLSTFNKFEEVLEAYKKQMEYYVSFIPLLDYITSYTHSKLTPTPFLSSVIDYRIDIGKDVSLGGGPNYNDTLTNCYGAINVGNSLMAIKKLIFDEKIITGKEFLEILADNFESDKGKILRQLILSKIPRYGNDIDEVDYLTRDSLNICFDSFKNYTPLWYGGVYGPSPQTLSSNVIMGRVINATPDGRKKGEPIADNISPYPGDDVNGPLATFSSVAKLDHVKAINGTILNMKFHPSALSGKDQIEKLCNLIKTFMVDKKGFQVQFNIVSGKTLRDAQKNPEKYKSLVVKVAGFSAFFVNLDKELQNQIIARTEHALL
ncbi:MAG: formate C-acetyltransferase/glycerol dehydratase family glycyl radical enzyme [Actinobacteria bacterium]|nr:formate C-acetyltransferase/glycerol dehydratase family glycyl radical enzyme [Actinomycetota bacterium]